MTLLAPIPVPPQIRDFLAFEQHLKRAFAMSERLTGRHMDVPAVWYEQPIYYKDIIAFVSPGRAVSCQLEVRDWRSKRPWAP